MSGSVSGTATARWPAVLMSLLVLAAAAYSFSPRPMPAFPATQVKPEGLQVNGVAEQAGRWIAAGELGNILIADDSAGPWRAATVRSTRGSTLTRVQFIGEGLALAVGHDGWILRSTDRGETWDEVAFDEELTDPLLSISGPHDGQIHAVGGFGRYLVSSDLGASWTPRRVEEIAKPEPAATSAGDAPLPFSGGDPFAMAEQGIADRHLNAIIRLDDGRLLLTGESGLIARSADSGLTWESLPEVYAGSFFGALALPGNGAIVFGMRGNVFVTRDGGDTWQRAQVPAEVSLFGGHRGADGRIVLVGGSNTLWISDDGGLSFRAGLAGDRAILADVLPIEGGWLTVGERGVRVQRPATTGEQP